MATTNYGWYNNNELRAYPLDDLATGTDDDGLPVPTNILVDLQLRWPLAAGRYAYLSGLTVTNKLVSAVFMAADDLDDPGTYTPLAAITLVKPINSYVLYALTPIHPGVGGFVVFGNLLEPASHRLATPRQGLLAHRIAQAYAPPGVTSLGKRGVGASLQGLVSMLAGPDITITSEELSIAGESRQALVFRLARGTTERNVLELYCGPCGARPESHNCEQEGIETINGVGPDCDGNLNISFVGLSGLTPASCMSIGAGIVLDHDLGIADLGTHRGNPLPGENQCEPPVLSISSSETSYPSDSLSSFPSADSGSDSFGDDDEWTVRAGAFSIGEVDGGDAYQAESSPTQNVATYNAGGLAIGYTILGQIRFPQVTPPALGGLILNWKQPIGQPYATYFAVFLDRTRNRLCLMRFNGERLVVEASVALGAPVVIGHWYRLQGSVFEYEGVPNFTIAAVGITDTDWPAAVLFTSSNRYAPASGYVGVGTFQCPADFRDFTATVIPM